MNPLTLERGSQGLCIQESHSYNGNFGKGKSVTIHGVHAQRVSLCKTAAWIIKRTNSERLFCNFLNAGPIFTCFLLIMGQSLTAALREASKLKRSLNIMKTRTLLMLPETNLVYFSLFTLHSRKSKSHVTSKQLGRGKKSFSSFCLTSHYLNKSSNLWWEESVSWKPRYMPAPFKSF